MEKSLSCSDFFLCLFGFAIGAMFATIFATIAAFAMVIFGKNH